MMVVIIKLKDNNYKRKKKRKIVGETWELFLEVKFVSRKRKQEESVTENEE